MADEQDVFGDLDTLPKEVRDFVLSPKVAEANQKISKFFKLKSKEEEELLDNEYKIFFKKISFAEFQNKIKFLAEANKQSGAAMQKMVTEELLLPINSYFDGEPERMLQKNMPQPPAVTREPLPRPREIRSPQPPKLITREPLSRPKEEKLSGFVTPVKTETAKQKLTTDWLQSEKPKKSEPKPDLLTTHYSPPTSGKPLTEAEDQELKTIKEKMTSADVIPAPQQSKTVRDFTPAETQNTASQSNEQLVAQILAAVPFPFKDEVQKIRFQNAVKNRMRGIRDQFETKELLLRSENLGGVGLAEPVADQAVGMIEKIVGEQNRRLTVAKKEELQMLAAQAKTALAQKTQARLDQELKEQEVRYKNLVTDKIKGAMDRPLGFLKKKATPTVEVPEIMMPAKESAKMTVPLSRPKMDDIKFSPTLVGPIEELKNFTLKDWQALGAKSSVISQKLSVLRHESYAKYVTAIAAFKESPLFALAQEILFESLSKNMPLTKALEERKNANRPSLSQNEINDILSIE